MIMPIIAVDNLDRSIAYYKDKLGFDVMAVMPGPDGVPNFAIVTFGPAMFGLSCQMVIEGQKGAGVVFMIYVPEGTNIDDYYNACVDRGVETQGAPEDQYWGDRTFAIIDPDGYYHMIAQTTRQMSVEEIQNLSEAGAHG